MPARLVVVACTAVLFCSAASLRADSERTRIDRLIEALQDPNIRYGASIALARAGREAVPALRQALRSEHSGQRIWSAYTLGEMGPEAGSASADLAAALEDADAAVRAAAAEALGKIGTGAAAGTGSLAGALGDENAKVRQQAALALGRIGPPAVKAVPRLVETLEDPLVRPHAKAALLQLGPQAVEVLLTSLDKETLRFDLAEIVSALDPEAARRAGVDKRRLVDLPSLRRVLRDDRRSERERTSAAAALASLGETGTAVLIAAFEDPEIAPVAARAFAHAGSDAVPALTKALEHELPGVRMAAADALGHIGPAASAAAAPLAQRFNDTDRGVRYRAVRALDRLGSEAAPAAAQLSELVLDSAQREPARQWAIKALLNTLPETHETVVETLIQASRDKGNYGVRSLARQQLLKIDPKAAEAAGLR